MFLGSLSFKSYCNFLTRTYTDFIFTSLPNIGPWISLSAKWNLLDLVFPEAQDTCTGQPEISEMWRICKWSSWRAAGERCLKLWVGVYETPIVQQCVWRFSVWIYMCLQYTCVQCACISDVFGLYFGGLCIEDVNVCIMCRVYVRLCVWCTVCSVCTFGKCV